MLKNERITLCVGIAPNRIGIDWNSDISVYRLENIKK